MIRQCFLTLLMLSTVVAQDLIFFKVNTTAEIGLPQTTAYRRIVYVADQQIYRVCNGKNKNKCGYWESVATKKKYPSGATTYNKNKKALIVKKLKETDFGTYTTGDKKHSQEIYRTL
uniref:SH3 domain-containing protein n=1 Tax=Caenorhabditis tropicalis TaxID=1561998 RepID=A0A1I7UW81_9PELO